MTLLFPSRTAAGIAALLLLFLIAPAHGQGPSTAHHGHGRVTSRDVLPPGAVEQPAAGAAFTEPIFGTRIFRLTDASKGAAGVVPEYAKRQAWNADESLLLLHATDGRALLYDGAAYRFLRELEGVGGEDVFWHPTDPKTLYFNPDNALYACRVDGGERRRVCELPEFAFANTRGEGNLSLDGRYYAVVGQAYDAARGEVKFREIVVLDLEKGRRLASLPLGAIADFDWVSVSPLGNHVVVDYADTEAGRFHGVEVYDREMRLLWQKPLGAGHSDLGLDARGDEVLVMAVYDPESNRNAIRAYRLKDGVETTLLWYDQSFDCHLSCRATEKRGWCLVSTFDAEGRLSDEPGTWLPFEDEVFFLSLDGSGAVERLAHHRSRRFSPLTPDSDTSVYWAEPHATASRRGDRVIFGSNWGESVDLEKSVDAWLIDLR